MKLRFVNFSDHKTMGAFALARGRRHGKLTEGALPNGFVIVGVLATATDFAVVGGEFAGASIVSNLIGLERTVLLEKEA